MRGKRVKEVVVVIALVVIIALGVYFFFGAGKTCEDLDCYNSIMQKCIKGSYISEKPEASWKYIIKGKEAGNLCEIEVVLLQAKEGDIRLREFEGSSMTCLYEVGVLSHPEKDISKCHGILKENIQDLFIRKLHEYILDNLDEVEKNLL